MPRPEDEHEPTLVAHYSAESDAEGFIRTGFTNSVYRYEHSEFRGSLVFRAGSSWIFVGDHRWYSPNTGRSGRSGTFAEFNAEEDTFRLQVFSPILTVESVSTSEDIQLITVPGTLAAFTVLKETKFDGSSFQTILEGSSLRLTDPERSRPAS